MAICYECDEQFYGLECPCCGWKAIYKCWKCKSRIDPEECEHCKGCGWYHCFECDVCGCHEDTPLSNQEKRGG